MIKVLFFAKLREELKINELDVEYKADVASIRELINHLRLEYQQIDNVKTPVQTIIVTVANRLKLDMSVSGITGTINVGDTADNGSGVTGTVTYVGSDFAIVDPASVSGGSFAQSDVVTFTSGGSGTLQVTPVSNYRYFFDGNEAADLTFIRGNTYRFDMSDSSNTNHPLDWDSTTSSDPLFERVSVGTEGVAGAFTA